MTDSERKLWSRLRGKQVLGIQFYRQKPIGNYIVDFYAPKVKIVIEVDGSQHVEKINKIKDAARDKFLKSQGLDVLRFNNLQVLKEIDSVGEVIYREVADRIGGKRTKSPQPPFSKGERTLKRLLTSPPPWKRGREH